MRLRLLTPPGGVAACFGAGRPRHRLLRVKAEGHVEEGGRVGVFPGPAGFGFVGLGARQQVAAGAVFQRPTPAARRTTEVPGFHSLWGTSTVIWWRARSTLTLGAGPGTTAPVTASVSTAVSPWTVRNSCAGALTLAPNGNGWLCPSVPPIAIAVATRLGFSSVLSVIRKAVASLVGRTRSSIRLAAFSS